MGNLEKSQNEIFLLLAFIMAVSGLHAEENKKLTIKKTPFPITINGYENDNAWQLITATPINKYDRNESTGMSGSFKMTYDDNFFYVICSIIDSTPLNFNPQNVRKSDMICLLFSMDTASNYGKISDGAFGAIYKPGFWNFYKLMAPDSIKYLYEYDISKPLGYGGSLSGNSNYDMTTFFENVNFKYAQQVNGNHS